MGTPAELQNRLYDEILECIVGGVPYPNPSVYRTPWLRDAAMVGLVLERTGEVDRIWDWILGLADLYDRNNAGHEEPDNLGQVLTLLSLAADASHPLVARVLEEAERTELRGLTDFGEHPVYAIKWMKYGLKRLGLDDPWEIPQQYDSYSALFWMDFKESHVPGPPVIAPDNHDYPYLQWAEAHFHGAEPPMHLLAGGPKLSWEANASQARYSGERICRPHSWHAAEAWLFLNELNSA